MTKRRNTMAIPPASTNHPDVVLVGAGIMSATLAVFIKELDPSLKEGADTQFVPDRT
jgi:hypothetical protein